MAERKLLKLAVTVLAVTTLGTAGAKTTILASTETSGTKSTCGGDEQRGCKPWQEPLPCERGYRLTISTKAICIPDTRIALPEIAPRISLAAIVPSTFSPATAPHRIA